MRLKLEIGDRLISNKGAGRYRATVIAITETHVRIRHDRVPSGTDPEVQLPLRYFMNGSVGWVREKDLQED